MIHRKAAKEFDLTTPNELFLRAERVIE